MIDRATVDRIMDAAQIVDVVSDFVTLRKAGVNYKGLCPFHDDRTPSFVVSPSKGLCKCFACGKGGNAVHFIMEHEQLSYPDALRYLARKYNIEIKERELTEEEKQAQDERESMFVVNEWACLFFQDQLYNTVDGRAIGMTYFRSRGFRDDIIKKFQLGYSPSQRDACAREAKAKGYKEEFLLSTGLCYKRDNGQLQDRFFGRVIFPVHTLSGKVVAFGGRVLDAATKGVNVKYQNSPESAIYSKKKELYGLFLAKQAIVKHDLCFLVEGYTDVISMHQMGVENVVSSSGTALTTEQIRMIHRFTENITVLYDGDAAGIKASERGIDMLLAEGMNVKLLLLPDGDDPDSFARKHNATEYQTYLNEHQVDFIKYKTDLLLYEAQGDPIKLSRLISSIVHTISVIPDEITRSVYTRETATMLNMEERMLVAAISKEMAQAKEEKQKQRENERNRKNVQLPSSGQALSSLDQDSLPPPTPFPPSEEGIPPIPDDGTPTDTPVPNTSPGNNPAMTENVSTLSYIPGKGAEAMLFYRKELLLVQVLIRYGEKIICYAENEQGEEVPVSVAEFVDYALQEDGLLFHNALHKRILQEAIDHIHEKDFSSERYFLNHPDNHISMLAFELSSDKYQLSKYHSKHQKIASDEERLTELVPHLISDFKLAIVDEELKQILLKLRQPDILSRKEEYMEIMKHYKEMKDIERTLARERGDRVIT
ncbi:DNA primase [Paraprevotella clara]|mgnify:CR=1 FL=1|uniref:DNA primase n=1 Tax=Paraprevotella clara TaxID=454154 RepID=UPI002675FB4C|nr:DNA primase [Paraprevotella clara]